MTNHCENILEHQCFQDYDETTDFLNIDENSVATISMNIYIYNVYCVYYIKYHKQTFYML